jgi:hypothetical protein
MLAALMFPDARLQATFFTALNLQHVKLFDSTVERCTDPVFRRRMHKTNEY